MHCPTLDHECLVKVDSHAEWNCETLAWHHSIQATTSLKFGKNIYDFEYLQANRVQLYHCPTSIYDEGSGVPKSLELWGLY